MSVFSEQVTRLQSGLYNAKTAIESKSGTVVVAKTTPTIEEIVTGINGLSVSNPAMIHNITSCKELYSGSVLWVNFPNTEFPLSTSAFKMLYSCASLTSVGDLTLPECTSIEGLLQGSSLVTSLGSIIGSKIINADYAFAGCSGLTSQPSFDMSHLTTMRGIYQGCTFSTIDLSTLDTTGITLDDAFKDCTATVGYGKTAEDCTRLNASTNKPSGLTFVRKAPTSYLAQDIDFTGSSNGTFVYKTSSPTDCVTVPATIKGVTPTSYQSLFATTAVKCVLTPNANGVTDATAMFASMNSPTLDLDLSFLNLPSATTFAAFLNKSILASVSLQGFNLPVAVSIRQMFEDCQAAVLNLNNMVTGHLTTLYEAFKYCKSPTMHLLGWDTSNVTTMESAFSNCKATSLDLSSFTTQKVTTMYAMFDACTELVTIDLSNCDLTNVTNVQYIFYGCTKLTTVYAKTSADVTKLMNSTGKPAGVTVQVK